MIIKITDERCLKSYKLSDPNFYLKKILRDMCQCSSELSPEYSNFEQENATRLSCDEESKETCRKMRTT